MRFLHTSDWHLGRLFHNVHLTDDQAYVLAQLLEIIRGAKLDAILVAGDIYDRAVPPPAAVQLLDETLSQWAMDLRIPTFLIAGNHDSPERLGFGARLLRERGLYVSGTLDHGLQTVTLTDAHGPVHILPVPFAVPEVVRQWCGDAEVRGPEAAMQALLASARDRVPDGERSLVIAHAFVAGGQESDSERSLSVGGSGPVSPHCFDGFDYVALGHLHRPQSVGAKHIRYSGSLLKYSFSEIEHQKSVSIVDMDASGSVVIETLPLRPRRELRAVKGSLQEVLAAAAQDENSQDYLLAVLNDREPLLNPMAKLRQHYPNVLHIERPHFGASTGERLGAREQQKMTTPDLFEAFWKQNREGDLGPARRAVIERALERLRGVDE